MKFCMASIMGTFLQSDMSEFRFIPLRRRKTFTFWPNVRKFGTKLVIFWIKIARDELKTKRRTKQGVV